MDWILFIVIASISSDYKAITTSSVPMATLELCNAAKAKLTDDYKVTQSPNFMFIGECLKVR